MAEENKPAEGEEKEGGASEMSLAEVSATLKEILPHIKKLMAFHDELKPKEEAEHGVSLDESEGEEKKDEKKDGEGMDAAIAREVAKQLAKRAAPAAMDSGALMAEFARKADLVKRASPFTGSFACDSLSYEQTAKYVADKLGLKAPVGSEGIAVDAYLLNRKPEQVSAAMDTGVSSAAAFLAEQLK